MKKLRSRVLTLFLCLCMLLSVAPAAAATGDDGPAENSAQTSAEEKGFRSKQFLLGNKYQYADNEMVRAIVVLKSAPIADIVGVKPISGAAFRDETVSAYKAVLAEEHTEVRAVMEESKIDYDVVYEFDTLLNGFSCDVAYGELDTIAEIPGVDAVYIANTYTIPRGETPMMESSNELTGNASVVSSKKANGEGTVIAILDGGAQVQGYSAHDAFKVPEDFEYGPLTKDSIGDAVAPGEYVSEKVPFAYDYADGDANVKDSPATDGHGSHVAGIAAGYAEDYSGNVVFSGAAPGAQLVIMKIFSDLAGTTRSDIYFAALEDCIRLGVDVINMSIGTDSGFTHDNTLDELLFGDIYNRLERKGIVVCVSAGNSGNMGNNGFMDISSKGYIGADYTDYGVVGSPSTYGNNISVASMENSYYDAYCLQVDDNRFEYVDTSATTYTTTGKWYQAFKGQTKEFVVLTGDDGKMALGKPEDYQKEGVEVTDKIAVVQRGEIDFQTKLNNAKNAGAAGLIVVNSEPGIISMQISDFGIPAVSVGQDTYDFFMSAKEKKVRTSESEEKGVLSSEAGRMSSFSSWGTTPDLTIKPTLTSVGGYVKSVGADDYSSSEYVYMSGTSMASPNLAGTFANVLSWLRNEENKLSKEEAAAVSKDLLESTAGLIYDEYGNLYSVRNQGAGLGLADKAIEAYEKGYIKDPLKELGQSEDGEYTFEVTLHNSTEDAVTYTPKAAVLTDKIDENGENTFHSEYLYNDFAGNKADNSAYYTIGDDTTPLMTVTVDSTALGKNSEASVTVQARQDAKVTVTLKLTEEGKAYLEDQGFENGAFIEGYIQFTAGNATPVHATFLGYYGDWNQAPALESQDFRDYEEAVSYLMLDETGQQLLRAGATPYDLLDVVTDCNLAAIVTALETDQGMELTGITPGVNFLDYQDDGIENQVGYDEKRIAISGSESAYYPYLYLAPYQLRNVKKLTVTISNVENEWQRYYETTDEFIPKAVFAANEDGTLGGVWGYYSEVLWDVTTQSGAPLENGTKVKVSFDVELPYSYDGMSYYGNVQEDAWSFVATIDSEVPKLDSITYDKKTGDITVVASDNEYLAGVYLVDAVTEELLDLQVYAGENAGESATFVFHTDDPSWEDRTNVVVAAMDYATNENTELFNLVDKDEVGKPVTIDLVTPAGTKRIEKAVGETFVFPECTESYSGCRFSCWSDSQVSSAKTLDEVSAALYAAGDGLLLTEGKNLTYYALFEYGSERTYSKTHYRLYDGSDYTGSFSINNARWAMDSGLHVLEKTKISDIEWINPVYGGAPGVVTSYDFNTADDSIRFDIRSADGRGKYTIKNKATGQYLCWKESLDGLEFSDTASENAQWTIVFESHLSGNTVRIYAGDIENGKVITAQGGSWNTTAWTLSDASGAVSDVLPRLSKAYDEGYEVDRYTTSISVPGPSFPPAPVIPGPASGDERPTKECPSAAYTDVPVDAWFHECVDYVIEKGLMVGVNANSFSPYGITTRAQLVTVLYSLEGNPAVTDSGVFEDVDAKQYYAKAVNWAAANGIVAGYDDGLFRPDRIVTREQMAAILYSYAAYKGYDVTELGSLSVFTDGGAVSAWAETAMRWAVAEGLFNGVGNNELRPAGESNRAQVAAVLMSFCKNVVK